MVGFQIDNAFKTTVFFTPENKFPLHGSSMGSILDNTIKYQLLLSFYLVTSEEEREDLRKELVARNPHV